MSQGGETGPLPWKGLDTSRMPVFIGYDQVERMVAALLESAAAWRPDEVVGIARGGLVPAAMAAGILALPLSFLSHDKATGRVTWIGPHAVGRRILLVDDCCSSGVTLHRARAVLTGEGRECMTLVVVHDPDMVQHMPDLSYPMRELFRLPWERGEATPTGRAAKASGSNTDLAAEAPFVGIGLNETFLTAITAPTPGSRPGSHPGSHPGNDPGDYHVPRFPLERAVFLANLEQDFVSTALAETPYRHLPLESRPPSVVSDRNSLARWKAETATRWGCTHFIESDAEQAIGISAHAPHLIVTWWQADAGLGWTVGAAAQPTAEGPASIPT